MTTRNPCLRHFSRLAGLLVFSTAMLFSMSAGAQVNTTVSATNYASFPIVAIKSATPFAMINMSNDHQLFFKAYNDYTDLDGDGVPDTTYTDSFQYYGYFDPDKCYTYSSADGRFEPAGWTASGSHYCSGQWSGNFLNWATMSRIDIVRKILFGGLRIVDTSTDTVLERAYLPNDAHSWAKYYDGADISKLTPFTVDTTNADPQLNGISICNTTVDPSNSLTSLEVTDENKQTNTDTGGYAPAHDPPLMRVAQGNYALWAGNERWQCRWSEEKSTSNGNDPSVSGINAASSNPSKASVGLGLADYNVRVHACVSGLINSGNNSIEHCKKYPDGNYKPIGLLQSFGDDDTLYFGLMAGTYSNNKKGGDLVKEIGSISDEVDVTGDGHFLEAHTSGKPSNKSWGIINALSLYQIIKYQHSDGTYGTGGLNANNCPWGLNSFGNGQCQNWGNPFAEIYLQTLRYFADAGVTGDFRSNDSNDIPALNTPQVWDDPIKETNRCTSLNVVNFNSSSISYDGDDIDSHLGDINTTQTSAALTNPIGTGEGIDGNSYFVGDNGAGSNNQLCTAKTVTALGNVLGVCPEAPRLDGTYKVAGLAYYAHTHDINPNVTDIQKVDTYSVALSTSTPHIDITLPGTTRKVTILPACRDSTVGGNCSLVDFKIVKQDPAAGTGTFYVNWEDSEQGGDFDQDMWGMISYTATSSTVTVSTNVAAQSTPYAMGFGYVISGTTQDGFHAHSGINSFSYSDPTGAKDCNNCQSSNPATSQTYTVGSSSGALLHDPLWYASKWGAFLDSNNNKKPDIQHEWDRKTVDGADGSDGIPDTFFAVSNPKKLEDALRRVFNDILAKTASGTAAAVVANAREGVGAVYQALYEPTRKDKNENEVNWIGTLHALFVDDSGHLREDLNGNKQLDGYQTDPVVEIFFDTTDQKTKYKELASGSDSTFEPTGTETVKPLTDLKTLWNARKQLSAMTNTEVLNQRSYSDIATTGRYIFTWLDDNDDGVVDSGEVKPFVPSTFSGNNVGYLNAANTTEATNIVDYIRGEDISGYRNRTMDYDGDGTEETLRLGDIVHSTPTVAATPAEAFDLLYNDESYAAFRKKYQNRRNVVYVGANDGLLHAFNGGFYDAQDRTFSVNGSNGETADPLGSELWAYAPMDLLPHLKWLTEKDYPHVYYMDAKPRIFDAKIFPADSDHPNGWGTVLVAGMRLGGGPITVDTDNNGLGTGNDMTMRSAFVLLDVTNPEKPPSLIAEIKPPNLGFTTNYPTAMAMRDPQSGSPNEWYLLFGSGPTKLSDATSSQDARFYVYDLNTKSFVTNYDGYDLGVSNSFVGDPVSVDWDLDFLANAVYFGTIGGTPSNPTGKLFRFGVDEEAAPANWVPPKVLLDTGKPIMATPAVTVDKSKTPWVFVGTGRFFSQADKSSTAQQALYGVKDTNPPSNPTVATSDLVDVSNAVVTDTGTLSGVSGSSATTVTALDQDITDNHKGWFLNFPAQSFSNSAQRSITQSSLLGESLLATAFTPDPDVCGNEGRSELYGLYYRTGTPRGDNPIFGTVNNLAVRSVDLGVGMAASPSLAKGSGVDRQQVVVFTQTSTGAIVRQQAGVSTSASSGEMSWQQPRQQ